MAETRWDGGDSRMCIEAEQGNGSDKKGDWVRWWVEPW